MNYDRESLSLSLLFFLSLSSSFSLSLSSSLSLSLLNVDLVVLPRGKKERGGEEEKNICGEKKPLNSLGQQINRVPNLLSLSPPFFFERRRGS